MGGAVGRGWAPSRVPFPVADGAWAVRGGAHRPAPAVVAAAISTGPGSVTRLGALVEVAVGAPGRAGIPGFVDSTGGAVDPLVRGGVPEQVQVTLQVEHVPALAWPGLRFGPGEGAAAEAAGRFVGLCCLAGV